MLEESRKRLKESCAALSKLTERNNANKMGPMDGISGIVVNVKPLLKWCEDCICSVDCQCNSCVYGCIRSVDCQCYCCLDDCSNKKNDGDNQTGMVSEQHATDALLRVENSSETDSEYNEHQVFDECPQQVGYEITVGFQSIQNTNIAETEIMNSHLNSPLFVVEDTIPKLMSLNDLSSAYNVTTHLESAPFPFSIKVLGFLFKGTRHKLSMELGDKRIHIKMERNILTALCGPHAIISSPSYAMDSYICNWVDTGQAFWACLYRLKSSVYAVSRVLLFSYFNGFSFLNVVDTEAKLPALVAMRSKDWDDNVSALTEIDGAEILATQAREISHLIIHENKEENDLPFPPYFVVPREYGSNNEAWKLFNVMSHRYEDHLDSEQSFFFAHMSKMLDPFDFMNRHLLAKSTLLNANAKVSKFDILNNPKLLAKNGVFEFPWNWGVRLLMDGNRLLHRIKFFKPLFTLGDFVLLCWYRLPPDQFRWDFPFDPGCSLLTTILVTSRYYSFMVVDDFKENIRILAFHIDSMSNGQSILNQFPLDSGANLFIVNPGGTILKYHIIMDKVAFQLVCKLCKLGWLFSCIFCKTMCSSCPNFYGRLGNVQVIWFQETLRELLENWLTKSQVMKGIFSVGRFGKVVIERSLGTAVQVAVKLHILLSNIKSFASMKGRAAKVSHLIIELQLTFDPGGMLIGPEKRINFMTRFCCWNDSREVLTFLYQVIIELSREVHFCQQRMNFPTEIAIREWKNAFIWDTYCRSNLPEDVTTENPLLRALGEHFLKFPFDPGGSSSAF